MDPGPAYISARPASDPGSSVTAIPPSGVGPGPGTPVMLVEAIDQERADLFAARVVMPDKTKVVVMMKRQAPVNLTIEYSLTAAATVWGTSPPAWRDRRGEGAL